MLYVTCSIFPQEGEQQIRNFMNDHKDAIRLKAPGQIQPNDMGDGFSMLYCKSKLKQTDKLYA